MQEARRVYELYNPTEEQRNATNPPYEQPADWTQGLAEEKEWEFFDKDAEVKELQRKISDVEGLEAAVNQAA